MFVGLQDGGEYEVLHLQPVWKVVCLGYPRKVAPSSPAPIWFVADLEASVKVASADTGEIRATLPTEAVHEIGFSPQGSYIITWQRPSTFPSLRDWW